MIDIITSRVDGVSRASQDARVHEVGFPRLVLTMSQPAKKPLTLYTNHLTPNGLKVSIYLEELKLVDSNIDYK